MRNVVLSMAAAAALIALPALAQNTGTTTGSSTDTTMGANTTGTTTGSTYDNTAAGGTYDNGTGTTTTTTTTGTSTTPTGTGYTAGSAGTVNGAPVQEQRTNPAVPTHSPHSGLTATGTIVSWNHSELVLRTSTGLTHFKMMPNTTGYNGNGTFQEGQTASVDFDRNEQGVLIARQVRLGEGVAQTTTTTTVTSTPATVDNTTTTTGTTDTTAATTTTPDTSATTTTPDTTSYNNNTATTTTDTDTTSSTASTTSGTRMPATASDSPLVALLGLMALGAAAGLRRL